MIEGKGRSNSAKMLRYNVRQLSVSAKALSVAQELSCRVRHKLIVHSGSNDAEFVGRELDKVAYRMGSANAYKQSARELDKVMEIDDAMRRR